MCRFAGRRNGREAPASHEREARRHTGPDIALRVCHSIRYANDVRGSMIRP